MICHTNIYEAIKLIFENKTSVLYSGKGNVRNHKKLLRNPNDRVGVYYLKHADFCVPVFNWIALIIKSQKDARRYFKDVVSNKALSLITNNREFKNLGPLAWVK